MIGSGKLKCTCSPHISRDPPWITGIPFWSHNLHIILHNVVLLYESSLVEVGFIPLISPIDFLVTTLQARVKLV